jgi:hypothetical protein
MSEGKAINLEFALAAACCAWPPSPPRDRAIPAAAAERLDWPDFLKVVRRHRVQGLAWHGLFRTKAAVPADIAAALKADADEIARTGLSFCAETIRLQRSFDQAGLRCAFLKGSTLASLAYGNRAIRHAKDIDLIVPEADLSQVSDLLIAAGYRRRRPSPDFSAAQLDVWYRYSKDMDWRHVAKGLQLELHWRLSSTSFLLKQPIDFSTLDAVELLPSAPVTTLPRRLFLPIYACTVPATAGFA